MRCVRSSPLPSFDAANRHPRSTVPHPSNRDGSSLLDWRSDPVRRVERSSGEIVRIDGARPTAAAASPRRRIGPLAPNGIPARLVLALLESAGILYANIGPVMVSALVHSGAFSRAEAGYVFSCNMLGTAIGGFCMIFLVHRLSWRRASAVLLVLLMLLDLLSAAADAPLALYLLRFAHGLTSGALIGVSMSVIARMLHPERTIALFIMLQLIVGGFLTMILTPLLPSFGTAIVWLSLIAIALSALVLLPLLDSYPVETRRVDQPVATARAPLVFIALVMLAIAIYQCGEMAAWAYVIELGSSYRFDAEFTSLAVALSLWTGGPAALIVTWWSTRTGRLMPFLSCALLMAGSIALYLVPMPVAFLAANIGFGVFFGISFSYLMGIASEMDGSGRMGTVAGFSSNIGLAIGPAVAAALLGEDQFARVLVFAVAGIVLSALLAAAPARMLDRRNLTGRVSW